jgi:ATP:corrinoid adenosyltransferase
MATTTAVGRAFFALGAFLTTSIYQHHKNRQDRGEQLENGIVVVMDDKDVPPGILPLQGRSKNQEKESKKSKKKHVQSKASSLYTKAALADQIHDDLPGLSYTPNFY